MTTPRKTQTPPIKTNYCRNLSHNLALESAWVSSSLMNWRRAKDKNAKRNEGKEEETSSLRVSVQQGSHR